jgi:hypothetical protein
MADTRLSRTLVGIGGALAAGSVSACGLAARDSVHLDAEPALHAAENSGSVAVSASPDPLRDDPLTYRLELKSSRSDSEPEDREVHLDVASSWHDSVSFDGELRHGDLLKLRLEGRSFDLSVPAEAGDFSFVEGIHSGWEQNRLSDVTFGLGLLNDRLRLTSRRASSSYSLFGNYSKRPMTKGKRRDEEEGKERLLDKGTVEGTAVSHQLDAEIWRSAGLSVSTFGLYSQVDPHFESVESSDKDPFGSSNRETLVVGTSLGFGPVQLTLSRKHWHKLDRATAPEESAYEAKFGVDLPKLTSRIGGRMGEILGTVAPKSAWVSAGRGEVESTSGPASSNDQTGDISFGLAWSWPSSYANLDFWQSRYDYRQPGSADYDWAGRGIYAGFGLSGESWNFDANFGLYRSEDQEVTIRSIDSGYDGSMSFAYHLENLPDLTASLYLGRYETDYVAYHGASLTDAWELVTAADFSKYLSSWFRDGERSLKLMYQFEGLTTRDSFDGATVQTDHTIALLFRLGF